MAPWSAQAERRARALEKSQALEEINLLVGKLRFERPVFFVPGWTDEFGICWGSPYIDTYVPIKRYVTRVFKNYDSATFVTFSLSESKKCSSFFDFGEILKKKIRKVTKGEFDLIGHSMGGLDSLAAISDDRDPLKGVNNLISVATPHRGSEWGELCRNHCVQASRKLKPHQITQGVQLDPDQPSIQFLNRPETRKSVIDRVEHLFCLGGTRDMAVFGSSRFDVRGLSNAHKKKVSIVPPYGGATHSGPDGITQDPRALRDIFRILTDRDLKAPSYNYGRIS